MRLLRRAVAERAVGGLPADPELQQGLAFALAQLPPPPPPPPRQGGHGGGRGGGQGGGGSPSPRLLPEAEQELLSAQALHGDLLARYAALVAQSEAGAAMGGAAAVFS